MPFTSAEPPELVLSVYTLRHEPVLANTTQHSGEEHRAEGQQGENTGGSRGGLSFHRSLLPHCAPVSSNQKLDRLTFLAERQMVIVPLSAPYTATVALFALYRSLM